MMKIGIAGLGLIGGSMAKAVRAYTDHEVYGFDLDETVLSEALSDGTLTGVLTKETLSECDLLMPALYPAAAVAYVKEQLPYLRNGLILIDLCGVKRAVTEPMRKLPLPEHAVYIGGHPMAGKEKSGYQNASADLFFGASMILVPPDEFLKENRGAGEAKSAGKGARNRAGLFEKKRAGGCGTFGAEGETEREASCRMRNALKTAEELFLSLGFGRITLTSAEEHDRVIAFTSQLAHVVSSAYVKSPTALKHYGFSAGSYKDMTRVARLNETMWTELFLDNREALSEELDSMIERLSDYREAIRGGKKEALFALLREGRERKEGIDSYENS